MIFISFAFVKIWGSYLKTLLINSWHTRSLVCFFFFFKVRIILPGAYPRLLKLWIYFSLGFFYYIYATKGHSCVCVSPHWSYNIGSIHWFCCLKEYYILNRNDNLPFIMISDLCVTAMKLLKINAICWKKQNKTPLKIKVDEGHSVS